MAVLEYSDNGLTLYNLIFLRPLQVRGLCINSKMETVNYLLSNLGDRNAITDPLHFFPWLIKTIKFLRTLKKKQYLEVAKMQNARL